MARQTSTEIKVEDLEYAVEHVVKLAYSPVRAGSVEAKHSIVVDRERVLEIALEAERLIILAAINEITADFIKRVDQCCGDLESVIKKTLNKDGLNKLRLAIRQKRYNSPPSSISEKYNSYKAREKT